MVAPCEVSEGAFLTTPEFARAFLAENPDVWPYAMVAIFAFASLGQAADAYGLDSESFGRICTAANEQLAAAREHARTGQPVEPRPGLLLV